MAADQGNLENLMEVSPSSDNEVLVLPSSYIARRVKHFAPNDVSTTTTSPPSTSTSSTQSQQKKRLPIQARNNVTTTSTIALADLSEIIDNDGILKENEILTSPQTSQLSVMYSLPGFGSTSLMVSLIVQIQQCHPERWVSYMDLRRVAAFMQKSASGKEVDERNWTLAGLICAYNKITCPSTLQQIEDFFKSADKVGGEVPIVAELFLDELDELPPKMQRVLLNIMSRDVSWENCQTRLWISSRSHLKPQLEYFFPEANVYELLPLLRSEQINLLVNYWKLTSCPNVAESKLRNFARGLHDQMENLIPNFYKTIGACPTHLLQLPEFFTHIVTKLEQDMTENHFSTLDVSITKIFEKFVKTKFEAYVDKVSCEQPALAMSSIQFRDKELRKLERIHVKTIISSYPKFKCNAKIAFAGNTHQLDQIHELYRVGICYEENGEIKFIHKMYAEFLLAQYFVDSGRLKNTNHLNISFFLNNILFDEGCKTTRKFFDAYLTIQQQERKKIRHAIVWTRLRCFLVKHYRLSEEADASGDDATADADQESCSRLTYDDIKNNGSVVHLAIMEGHFKILQMIMDCFKGSSDQLKKLLSMKVPLEIFDKNPFTHHNLSPDIHLMDSFQMLSMYGYGTENMEKFITSWFFWFGVEYMAKYFKDGTWTVLHYAAMNSNCYFLHALLSKERKWERVQVTQRNPDGKQPIHLVLTQCWYYSIRIKDHPHPELASCMITASTSSSKAVQDAINAASAAQEQPMVVTVTSSSSSSKKRKLPAKATKRQLVQSTSPSSTKKSKTVTQKPVKPIRRPSNRNQIMKVFKDIWCFEGLDKEFAAEWDLYSVDAEWNPLRPHLTTLALLVENGCDVNAEDDVEGKTILHQAAALDSVKVVRYLVEHGAEVNVRDDFEMTPAHYAVVRGNVDMLDAMIGEDRKDNLGTGNDVSGLLKNGKNSSMTCNIC